MEHHEIQKQEVLKSSEQAPPSLLTNVMNRLEQRKSYLSARIPEQEHMVALQHPQWEIRAAAVHALGGADKLSSRDLLLKALNDEHRLVRAAAVHALGRLGEHAPFDILLRSMQDPAWEVREMVILTLVELGNHGPDPIKSLLLAAQHDSHSNVRDAATFALNSSLSPSEAAPQVAILDAVSLGEAAQPCATWPRVMMRYCLIFSRQIALIPKSIWISTLLLLLVWGIQYLPVPFLFKGDAHTASLFLALLTTVAAATGTAFIFGGEHDSAFELTLSTPTSIRVVMFSRFLLVVGYNILLAAGASAIVALLDGGGFWATIQLWFGPLVLLSSLTLTLSLLMGSWLATYAALVVELSQTVVFHSQQHWLTFDFVISQNWQTSPILLILSIGLLIIAALYAPRQPRLAAL
ncbi:MAG TPA: HEAT repeat domain-containing protein [Ktedonobacteraceae bacterium]|nr:HEAT repeat domain-containing protein [Ktedonobacteraceae bacterium]